MKVSALPQDLGPAGWNAILPEPTRYPALRGDLSVDWLIVGAGFAGLSAARRLRQLAPKDRIAVVDATQIAAGPAGRNSGFMIDLPHDLASDSYTGAAEKDRATTAQNRAAIAFAAQAAADYAMPDEALRLSGKINAAATPRGDAHNADYAKHLKDLGEDYTLYDAAQMHDICGSNFYTSGLYTPGTAILQPAAYIRGLAGGLASEGLEIFEDTPVTELTRENGWSAITPAGRIQAKSVILGVNGHVQSFGFFPRQLMHVFTYASLTRPLTQAENAALGGQADWGVTPADPMGTTVRRISGQGGDRIVIRNRFTYEPKMVKSPDALPAIVAGHKRSFAARFPMLPDVDFEYQWGGRLCLSRNDVPAFGQLKPRLFSACCQNGLGTVKGTLAGMRAAELATGVNTPELQEFANQPAPSRLPLWPLPELGAPAYLRWQERKAGREL
ncbi:MAG: FAD-binding oxidoreductase [Pseudomonadota bacterium]